MNTKKKKIILSIIIVLSVIAIALISRYISLSSITPSYNKQVNIFNQSVDEYNNLLLLTSADNIAGYDNDLEKIPTFEKFFDVFKSIFKGNSKNKINKDIETVKELENELKNRIAVLKQITAPSTNWVIKKLSELGNVTGTEAVTIETDVNGLLGKDGGYQNCVYFSLACIDQKEIPGETIAQKGTDCGGSVEIFSNKEDAEARCNYLSQYDNTILYSGSYAIIGTMVIRFSYIIDGETQYELTNQLTKLMTTVE